MGTRKPPLLANAKFTREVRVNGRFNTSYVFENDKQVSWWIETEFPKLLSKYGTLDFSVLLLPGLKIGDTCRVWGDGDEEYKIVGLVVWQPYRYGFILDAWCEEGVEKCYRKRCTTTPLYTSHTRAKELLKKVTDEDVSKQLTTIVGFDANATVVTRGEIPINGYFVISEVAFPTYQKVKEFKKCV